MYALYSVSTVCTGADGEQVVVAEILRVGQEVDQLRARGSWFSGTGAC